jgi:hypothetical protein
LDDVEPFVLGVVDVARGAALGHFGVLEEVEVALGVGGGDLGGEGDEASDFEVVETVAVGVGGDVDAGGGGRHM